MTTTGLRANLLVVSFLLVSCDVPSVAQTRRPITEAETVLAIFTEDWGLRSFGPPKLILVAWNDGRILWSGDRVRGGPPYREAEIDVSRLNALLSDLDDDGLFDIEALEHARFGPDSAFTTMLLKSKGKQLRMQSWHELVEQSPNGIARKIGAVSGERPRLHVLQEEPQDYLFYRFVWAEIRARALELVPARGDPVEGEVLRESGQISWRAGGEPRR